MKILLHEDPFSGIASKIYFNDGRTRYYTETGGEPVHAEYEYFRIPGHAPEASSDSLLDCRLLCCGEYWENHYDKRLNQQFLCVELILEGGMYVRCGGMIYLAEAGDIAVMPPHQDFEFRPAGKKIRKIGMLFEGRLLDGILAGSGIARAVVFTPERPLQEMLDAVESMRVGMEEKAPDCIVGGAVFRILALLEKMYRKDHPEERFVQLRQYVDDHLNSRSVLRDCCKVFKLSPYLLRKSFMTALHTAPKAYLAALRMDRAATMLMDGCSIKETALQCGYDNSLNFSTAFRRWHHLPPGKYRRKVSLPGKKETLCSL